MRASARELERELARARRVRRQFVGRGDPDVDLAKLSDADLERLDDLLQRACRRGVEALESHEEHELVELLEAAGWEPPPDGPGPGEEAAA